MQIFRQNILNTFGEKGKKWLVDLPLIVEKTCSRWKLSYLEPVDNMTYNYVAKAIANNGLPVVLKISCDEKLVHDEMQALKHFEGHGSINLMDYDKSNQALLLQQAIPGTTLKTYYPVEAEFVMDCYASTIHKLHSKPLQHMHHFPHVDDWLKSIDSVRSDRIPEPLLKKAIRLKNAMSNTPGKLVVLHGDLHHDNILKDGDQWLAIDPKGIIGESEFEAAAFDFIHETELKEDHEIKKLFEKRSELLAKKSKLDLRRLRDWTFVRLILAAAWCIEDKGDPSWDLKMAAKLFG